MIMNQGVEMKIKFYILVLLLINAVSVFAVDSCFKTDAETVGHWKFNGNIKASVPETFSGKAANPAFIESKFGKAIKAGPSIMIAGKSGFEKIKDKFSIRVLFKINSLENKQQAVIWKRSRKPRNGFLLQILNNQPLFCFYNAEGKQYHIYGGKLSKADIDKWISLEVIYDSEKLIMIVNGRIVAEKNIKNAVMEPGSGYLYAGSTGNSRVLVGEIDEILISTNTEYNLKEDKKVSESGKRLFPAIAGSYLFNFSSPHAKPFDSFKRVDVNTMYGGKNRYGWVFDGRRGEGSQTLFQRRCKVGYAYPDNLTGTAIHFRGGKKDLGFQVDVKPGNYIVALYLNAFADGNKVYNLLPYKVYANDKLIIDHKVTRESFTKEFYRGFDDKYEWRPGGDVWRKYLKDEVSIYKFPVDAADGKINLKFQMPAKAFGNLTGLLSLNGMIIVPQDKKAALNEAMKAIEQERRRQFYTRCKEKIIPESNKLPELSGDIRKLGYIPFSRYFMKQVLPNTVPLKSEIGKPISIFAAQGQRQIATFSLYPLNTLKNVKITVSGLKSESGNTIPQKALGLYRIRYIEEPLNYRKIDDNSYMPFGKLLVKNKPFTIEKGVTRRYLLEINTPQDIAAGIYTGRVSVQPENAPEYEFEIKFKVYPFKLESYADDDERIWIYYPWGEFKKYKDLLWDENNKWECVDKDLAMMKKYSVAPTVGFDWFMTNDELEKFMDIYQKYNFRGLAAYGGYNFLRIVDKIHKTPGKHGDYSKFINRMKEIEALRKKNKWPGFAYYTTAEIHNGMPGYLEGKWAINKMKKAAPEATFFCLPNHVEEFELMQESKVDIIGPNAISMREEVVEDIKNSGKKMWFYGWGRERFRCGLIGWRLGNRGGLKEWWTATVKKPLNPYDSTRFFDTWNDAPPYAGPNGPIPTMGLEETTAGRLDFLYLATLDLWMERAGKAKTSEAKNAILEATQFLNQLKQKVKPDYYFYYRRKKELRGTGVGRLDYRSKEKVFNWPVDDYIKMRRRAADIIVKLKKAAAK